MTLPLQLGHIVTAYDAEWGQRIQGGVIWIKGKRLGVLVPTGEVRDCAASSAGFSQIPHRAALAFGDEVIFPERSKTRIYTVTGFEPLSGGTALEYAIEGQPERGRMFTMDSNLLIRRRVSLSDLYLDLGVKTEAPVSVQQAALFGGSQ